MSLNDQGRERRLQTQLTSTGHRARRAFDMLRNKNLTQVESLIGRPVRIESGQVFVGNTKLSVQQMADLHDRLLAMPDPPGDWTHKVARLKDLLKLGDKRGYERAIARHFRTRHAEIRNDPTQGIKVMVMNTMNDARYLRDDELVEFFDYVQV
jgi:hypothetical protein